VSFRDGVYDITEFLKGHPGGSDKIMVSAGGPIEPFWEIYGFHKKEGIYKLLEHFRIGNLHPDD
jgi:sulfite oxidase